MSLLSYNGPVNGRRHSELRHRQPVTNQVTTTPGMASPDATCPDGTPWSSCSNATTSDRIGGNRQCLTRKRSLVQIQYGLRHFSKTCLVLGSQMGARLLRFCPISAGHRVDVPASAQGVPAVPVRSKRIATDATACGNQPGIPDATHGQCFMQPSAVRHGHPCRLRAWLTGVHAGPGRAQNVSYGQSLTSCCSAR
jgi:hypothetical protein